MKKFLGLFLIVALGVGAYYWLFIYRTREMPTPEEVKAVGNLVTWNAVEGCESYDVYFNDDVVTTTSKTWVNLGEVFTEGKVVVVAKGTEMRKPSAKSQEVNIFRNTNFSDDLVMNVQLQSNMEVRIPSNIRRVNLSMAEGVSEANNSYIILNNRTQDLILHLNQIVLHAPDNRGCIQMYDGEYTSDKHNFNLIILAEGDSILTGGDYTTVPNQPTENSNSKGRKGGEGFSAIAVPRIMFQGSGGITLRGGNGGPGGKGSDSSGISLAVYGSGGDGGNGGCGLKCESIILCMEMVGAVNCYGGEGGDGGSPGRNGSIMTGPTHTSEWSSRYGKDGDRGQGSIGELQTYEGTFYSE